jgi:DNA-binding transcriptional MerR regulator
MSTMTVEPVTALRRSEAAEMLGVHPNTILSWARKGLLEQIEFPNERRYSEESVKRLRQKIYGSDE